MEPPSHPLKQCVLYLKCDFVFHQQPNFDVHEIEIILQLLIGPEQSHNLLTQLHQIQLLLKVLVTLIQQVDKLPNHHHGRLFGTDCGGKHAPVKDIWKKQSC